MPLVDRIPAPWRPFLEPRVPGAVWHDLDRFLETERRQHAVFPQHDHLFRALQLTPPQQVRCVILGQDPYHGTGQAHGLAFSVPPGLPLPPSLKNIYRELAADLGISAPRAGDLSTWAQDGVLLLNTVLTVRENSPLSHRGHGWEQVTNAIVDHLAQTPDPIAFVLWGRPAQAKRDRIPSPPHGVFESAHPSPLSARRGFFGSQPFTRVNQFLQQAGRGTIDWQIKTPTATHETSR